MHFETVHLWKKMVIASREAQSFVAMLSCLENTLNNSHVMSR